MHSQYMHGACKHAKSICMPTIPVFYKYSSFEVHKGYMLCLKYEYISLIYFK